MSNYNTPAAVQEFMYRTKGFWKNNPKAMAFFRYIAQNHQVKSILKYYHKSNAALLGCAFRPDRENVAKEESRRDLLEKNLSDMVIEVGRNYNG